jgi:O-glycosyl hydrolase
VDAGTDLQRLDGFGSWTRPLVYGGADHLGSLRPAALKAAFQDVGMSLGLLFIGMFETPSGTSDPWAMRQNDNNDPFTINPSGFNFDGSDIIRSKVLVPARQYGYEDVTLGGVLQPSGRQSWMQDIRSTDYQRYLDEAAEHVLQVVSGWQSRYGEEPRYIELFNEPTSGNRELASTSQREVVDLVRAAGRRLTDAGFDARFIVPNEETPTRSADVAEALLSDPTTRPYVAVLGYHPYPYGSTYASTAKILTSSGSGSPNATAVSELERLRSLGQQFGVPVWLTEVSEGPGRNDFEFGALENVLARAIHIHDNFLYAGASAYFCMQTIWDSWTHADHFGGTNVSFLSEHSGAVLVDVDQQKVMITGMGYAIGHYARWVKPGAFLIPATSPEPRVIVTALRDASRTKITVVVVNNTDETQPLRITLSGATPSGPVSGEQSYGSKRWEVVSNATLDGDAIVYTAPARSVVTLQTPVG